MPTYRQHGIAFVYPEGWQCDEDGDEETTTITVHDGGAAFWSLYLLWQRPPVAEVVSEIEETFRNEYEQVDVEASRVTIARRAAEARQIDFFCLELVNTAFVRVFRTGRFTVLVLAQATDHELETVRPQLEEISDSLDVDLDGEILIA